MIAVAVLLPWLALILRGYPFQAAFCPGLQLTLIGWIPAAIWGVLMIRADNGRRQYRRMLEVLHGR
jgi:uncharacterized membrane protein YqaE (UPF0057 family)